MNEDVPGFSGASPTQVNDRYFQRLAGLARRHLDERQRQKMDADDIVQSVFRSFYLRKKEGLLEIRNWNSLWSLLAKMTVRKCWRRNRDYRGQNRDVSRELTESKSNFEPPISRFPSPDEVAQLNETIKSLVSPLPDYQQDIVVYKLQGFTNLEISKKIGRTERTVYRVLSQIRNSVESE